MEHQGTIWENKMQLFRFCLKYLWKYKVSFVTYILINIFMGLIAIILPLISGNLIDSLTSTKSANALYQYLAVFLIISILQLLLGFLSQYLYTKVQTKSGYAVNSDTLKHIQKLSMSFIDNTETGYLIQRINNDSNEVIIFSIGIIINVCVNLITLTLSFMLLLHINTVLAVALLFLIGLYWVIYKLFKKPLYRRNLELKEQQAKFFSKLLEQLTKLRFFKTHEIISLFMKKLDESFFSLLKQSISKQKLNYAFTSCETALNLVAQFSIFLFGGLSVINGTLTIGFFTVLLSYFSMMIKSARYFFNLGSSYQNTLVSYNRLLEILNQPIPLEGTEKIARINSIRIKDLSFQYSDKPVFKNFSLSLEKGKLYALTGVNGSGKSTLIDILLGLYPEEYSGSILYNNIELRELKKDVLRKFNIGLTEQEPQLIPDTIYNNLTLYENVDHSLLKYLIQIMGLANYIQTLPEGMNTKINESSTNLSGGEKQKISIIRQLIKNNDFMIFDEPTSALDKASKENFWAYINKIKKEKIILVVTHDSNVKLLCDENIELKKFNTP